MTLVVTHSYNSTITESTLSGGAGGLVGPTEWNANHTLTGTASPAQGGTGITSGTGVTYFSSATVIADSGTLTANALVVGGGANGAPATLSSLGTTSQVLHGNASGNPSFGLVDLASQVSGTLPSSQVTLGGANTNVQFNNSSVLGGDSGFTYAGNGQVTLALGTITVNEKALNVTGTWNASGVTFDAPIFANITNTASALGSALIDLQQGGIPNLMLFNRTASTVSPTLTLGSSATATQFLVYNTVDTLNNPTNYERAVFDWTISSNVLTIGTQAGGTGSTRNLQFIIGGTDKGDYSKSISNSWSWVTTQVNGGFSVASAAALNSGADASISFNAVSVFEAGNVGGFAWSVNSSGTNGSVDTGLFKAAAKVVEFSDGAANANGWMNWAGESRVSANSTTTSTALANVPGLAFKPQASRNYSFEAHLIFTDAAAGGIQCTVNATSTTTTYTLTFDGWVTDTVAVRGYAQGSAFGNVVASSLTTSTVAHVTITGTLMTSATAPSTVTIQFAQNTSNATPTTILIGSYMWAHDMP